MARRHRLTRTALVVLTAVLSYAPPASAQSGVDGTIDPDFNPGANNAVGAILIQPDRKIIVGGHFTTLGGGGTGTTTRNYLGRLNPDGSPDPDFDPGANGGVYAVAVQSDGKILVGGYFTSLGGGGTGTTTRNYLGRLNPDGTIDSTFNPGANNAVFRIVLQADGKILVGGRFTTLGGGGTGTSTRYRLGRLNPDGSLDSAFNPTDWFNEVWAIVPQPDGTFLVGGNRLARLNADGSQDPTFTSWTNGFVKSLVRQPDGKTLVGGGFTLIGSIPRRYLARLNADGSLDSAFDPGANDAIEEFGVQPNGKILVGGRFSTLGGGGTGTSTRLRLARLLPNGSLDPSFTSGTQMEAYTSVYALALQDDGKILVGGGFWILAGATRFSLGRLNGELWSTKLYTLTPCRLFDTRNSAGPDAAAPALGAGQTRTFSVAGRCGIPATARSLAINATVTAPGASGNFVLFPGDLPWAPGTSTLSFKAGVTRANNSILVLDWSGGQTFKVLNSAAAAAHFILDVNAYFQ